MRIRMKVLVVVLLLMVPYFLLCVWELSLRFDFITVASKITSENVLFTKLTWEMSSLQTRNAINPYSVRQYRKIVIKINFLNFPQITRPFKIVAWFDLSLTVLPDTTTEFCNLDNLVLVSMYYCRFRAKY